MKLFKKNKIVPEKKELKVVNLEELERKFFELDTFVRGTFDIWSFTSTRGLVQRIEGIESSIVQNNLENLKQSIEAIMDVLLREGLIKEQVKPQEPDFIYDKKPMVIVKKKK